MSIFTKLWSIDDNGVILTGEHLGEIQRVLDDLFDGGLVNAHFSASAGLDESKVAFSNNAAGHVHDNSASGGSYAVIPHYRHKCDVAWGSVSSVSARPGVIEIDDKLLVRTTSSTTITDTTDAHWIGGVSGAAISTWYYVYAYNDSAVSWDIKYSTSAPNTSDTASNTGGDLIYRQFSGVWYRCLQAVRNDAAGDLIKFYSQGNVVLYDAWTTVLSAGVEITFTDVDCATVIPVVSSRGLFALELTGPTLQGHIRPNGSSATDGNRYDADEEHTVDSWCDTDASQIIEYKIVSGTSMDIHVKGYVNKCY